MTNQEAIETIEANYPSERYSMLREALNMAIALLKEQEPRVMTLEEVKVCKEPVYLEEIPFSIFGSFFNWGLVCTANKNDVTVSVMLRNATVRHCACAMYGKRWRCWTAKPTDKQRQEVKCDGFD